MKKILFLFVAVICMSINTYAEQRPLKPSKFTDNLSLGITVGDKVHLKSPYDDKDQLELGLNFTKMITPVFGLQLEGVWSIKDCLEYPLCVRRQYVGINSVTNLFNLFGGYNGKRRVFDMDMILGIGWGHYYMHDADFDVSVPDKNFAESKMGLSFNVNLGTNRNHTISFKPYMSYCLDDGEYSANYNLNRANLHLAVGYTYHFKTSNGTYGFAFYEDKYTQKDIDALNTRINELRDENTVLRNKPTQVRCVEKTVEVNKIVHMNTEHLCTFEIGKSDLTPVEARRLARFVENMNKDFKVSIQVIGSADTETGSKERNMQLAQERAKVVADFLKEQGIEVEVLNPVLDVDKGVKTSRAALVIVKMI